MYSVFGKSIPDNLSFNALLSSSVFTATKKIHLSICQRSKILTLKIDKIDKIKNVQKDRQGPDRDPK